MGGTVMTSDHSEARRIATKKESIREECLNHAADCLRRFIEVELRVSVRDFAAAAQGAGYDIPESTLRYFVERRHTRTPYRRTLQEVVRIPRLPAQVREALLDVIDFNKRVLGKLLTSAQDVAQSRKQDSAQRSR
jgi:hypothetical protein